MMGYADAIRHADQGRRIRRDCWETCIVRSGRRLHFELPAALAAKLGTEYDPTETDMRSADWVLGP